MERLLGAFEHSFWLDDRVHPVHFSLCANIIGKFTIEQLRQSLDRVQQQHPLLRTCIAITPTGRPKFVEQSAEIPVRVVAKVDDLQWQQEPAIELSQSFNWAIAPLVRVVLLHSAEHPESSELIVTFHHSIADGLSGAYLIRDIVTGIEIKTSMIGNLADRLPVESLMPDRFKPDNLSTDSLLIESELIPPPSSESISTRIQPHVRTALLSSQLTQQLTDRCRQEQTSVHGAISAAFLLTLARQQPAAESPLKCLSPISVRSHLTPAVEQAIGLYITYGLTHHQLTVDSSFWEVARSLKSQLAEERLPDRLFEGFSPRQTIMETCPEAQMVVQGMQQQYGYDLLVTNLGRVEIEQQLGTLQIAALYGPAVMAGVADERVVGVATLGDRLSLTAAFTAASISATTATQTLDEALVLLSDASIYNTNKLGLSDRPRTRKSCEI
jgi:hypothetical protein